MSSLCHLYTDTYYLTTPGTNMCVIQSQLDSSKYRCECTQDVLRTHSVPTAQTTLAGGLQD